MRRKFLDSIKTHIRGGNKQFWGAITAHARGKDPTPTIPVPLEGLFNARRIFPNLLLLESTWPAPDHLRPLTLYYIPQLGAEMADVEETLQLYADFYQSDHPRPLNVLYQKPTVFDQISINKSMWLGRRHHNLTAAFMDPDDKMLLHGTAVGSFQHALHITIDTRDITAGQRDTLKPKIVGQLHDSSFYFGGARFAIGSIAQAVVDAALSADASPRKRRMLTSMLNSYLEINSTMRIRHLDSAYDDLVKHSPLVPTLTFMSEDDPLSDAESFEANIVDEWRQCNPDNVIHHCFEESPRGRHLQTHPEIYKQLFREYLTKVQPLLEAADVVHLGRRAAAEAGEENPSGKHWNPYGRDIRTY